MLERKVSRGLIPVQYIPTKNLKKNTSFRRNEIRIRQLIMEQHKFASVINTESRDSSDMLEAYAAPTVKYKSITIVTTLTIIYTTRVG